MKKEIPIWLAFVATIVTIFITGYFVGWFSVAHAEAMTFVGPGVMQDAPLSSTTIEALIKQDAQIYGVDATKLTRTLNCESQGWQNIQSELLKSTGPNGREDSWGLAQIHLPDHPNISRSEALDETWSIAWAASHFGDHASWWSCYQIIYGQK